MKTSRSMLSPMTLAVLATGYFATPLAIKAADGADSAPVNQLLSDTKMEAVHLKNDSEGMQTFIATPASWGSYSPTLEAIKGHIDNAGKLLATLKTSEATGSAWQQTAVKRIEPLLKELADNTTETIKRLSANPGKVHDPTFQDYVRANYQLATGLQSLILDFVDYGSAKNKFDSLASKVQAGN
jgi:hypothetical protein